MISFLISAIKIIFLLGFLIFIHESGHFIVAKLCKVRVNEFAIGFGPTVWKKQGEETKYALRLIPLGGFISMEGEEQASDKEGSFSKASIPKRVAIVAAGALVNIIFGLAVYFILIASSGVYVSNEVDSTINGYVAEELGICSGDKIVEIDNKKIKNKKDIENVLKNNNGKIINVKVKRNDNLLEYNTKLTEVKSKSTGIYLGEGCKIVAVENGSVAQKQGLKPNDIIIKINNEEVNKEASKVLELINNSGDTLTITVKRSNDTISVTLKPDYISSYYFGINFKKADDTFINRLENGYIQTKEFSISILDNLKQLFTGKVGVEQMTGPIGISEAVSKTNNMFEFIYMLALISLSLGVTNLLPIPALDGGKIVLLAIEAIRRKPLSSKLEINIQLIGFSILIALSLYVTYNDILRIF